LPFTTANATAPARPVLASGVTSAALSADTSCASVSNASVWTAGSANETQCRLPLASTICSCASEVGRQAGVAEADRLAAMDEHLVDACVLDYERDVSVDQLELERIQRKVVPIQRVGERAVQLLDQLLDAVEVVRLHRRQADRQLDARYAVGEHHVERHREIDVEPAVLRRRELRDHQGLGGARLKLRDEVVVRAVVERVAFEPEDAQRRQHGVDAAQQHAVGGGEPVERLVEEHLELQAVERGRILGHLDDAQALERPIAEIEIGLRRERLVHRRPAAAG
jgi:hypothetical protein